jgi:uncharacterized membrane protein YhfC
MKKDIDVPKVEGVSMAVVRELDEDGETAWYVYLINTKDVGLDNVLISSKGFGELDGEQRATSEMRHYLESLGARSWARIERIVEDVFALSNQYWLSFYVGDRIYDRKYIFVAGSIHEDHFTTLPLMEMRGVLIR